MANWHSYRNRIGRNSMPQVELRDFGQEINSPKTPGVKALHRKNTLEKMPSTRSLNTNIMPQTALLNTGLEDDAFSPQAQVEQAFTKAINKQYKNRELMKHADPAQIANLKKEELERHPQKKIQSLIDQAKKRIGMDHKKNDKEYKFKRNFAKFKDLDTYFDVSDLIKKMAEDPEKFEQFTSTPERNESKFAPSRKLPADEKAQETDEKAAEDPEEALQDIQRLRAQDKFRAAQERAKKFQVAMKQPKEFGARALKKVDLQEFHKALKEKQLKQKIKEQIEIEIEKSSKIRKQIRDSSAFTNLKNYLEENETGAASPEERFDEANQRQYWDDIHAHLQDLYDNEIGGSIKKMPENDIDDNVTEYIQAIQSRIRKDLAREEEDLKLTERLSTYKTRSDKVINMLKTASTHIYKMKWAHLQNQEQKKALKEPTIFELDDKEQLANDDISDMKSPENDIQPDSDEDQADQYQLQLAATRSFEIDPDDTNQAKEEIMQESSLSLVQDDNPTVSSNTKSLFPPIESKSPHYYHHQRTISDATPSNENFTLKPLKKDFSEALHRKSSLKPSEEAEQPHLSQFFTQSKVFLATEKSERKEDTISPSNSPGKSLFHDKKAKKFFSIDCSMPDPKMATHTSKLSSVPVSPKLKEPAATSLRHKLLLNISNAKSYGEPSTDFSFRRKSLGVDEQYSVRSTPGNRLPKFQFTPVMQKTTTSAFTFANLTRQNSLGHFQTKLEALENDTMKLKQKTQKDISKIDRTMDKMGTFYEKKYKEYLIRCEKVPTSLLKPTADADLISKKRKEFADNLTKKLLTAVN